MYFITPLRRKAIKPEIRADIFDKINFCLYCYSSENLQIEHIYPVAKDGNNHPSNLGIACKRCNGLKYEKTIEDFFMFLWDKRDETYRLTKRYIKEIKNPPYSHYTYTEYNLYARVKKLKKLHHYYSLIIRSIIRHNHIKYTYQKFLEYYG